MKRLVCTLITIPIFLFLKSYTLTLTYTNQGFFCNDIEVRYPNKPDTVPSDTMQTIYFTITVITIVLCELSLVKSIRNLGSNFHQFAVNVFLFIGIYICACLANMVCLNIFKTTASRLRPNFIDVCKPAHLDELCPLGSSAYIEDFTCKGEQAPYLHFSFPSGHSSHSIFFAVFIIAIIHLRSKLPTLIKVYAQLAVFVLAVYVCLTRVRDNKHRYVDVFGGGMLGFTLGMSLMELTLKHLRPPTYNKKEEKYPPIFIETSGYKSIP